MFHTASRFAATLALAASQGFASPANAGLSFGERDGTETYASAQAKDIKGGADAPQAARPAPRKARPAAVALLTQSKPRLRFPYIHGVAY